MITLNANGLRSPLKRRALFTDLRKSKSAIVLLQETHCTTADEKIWLSEWGGLGFFSHGRSNARGVAILLSQNFSPRIDKQITDADGRLLVIQFKRADSMITVVNIYAPTQSEAAEQSIFMGELDETFQIWRSTPYL